MSARWIQRIIVRKDPSGPDILVWLEIASLLVHEQLQQNTDMRFKLLYAQHAATRM